MRLIRVRHVLMHDIYAICARYSRYQVIGAVMGFSNSSNRDQFKDKFKLFVKWSARQATSAAQRDPDNMLDISNKTSAELQARKDALVDDVAMAAVHFGIYESVEVCHGAIAGFSLPPTPQAGAKRAKRGK